MTSKKPSTPTPQFSGVSVPIVGETSANAANGLGVAGVGRRTVQDVFIRVCRDSQWSIDAIRAAKLTALIVGKHPLLVWGDVGTLDIMHQIAAGTHPACHRTPTPQEARHD